MRAGGAGTENRGGIEGGALLLSDDSVDSSINSILDEPVNENKLYVVAAIAAAAGVALIILYYFSGGTGPGDSAAMVDVAVQTDPPLSTQKLIASSIADGS